MSYSLNLGAWNAVFAVPSVLVDQHIKLAGGAQLKVLLWMLRHAGEDFQPEDIGEALRMAPADVKDAMNYWTETGLLTAQETALTPPELEPAPPPQDAPPEPDEPEEPEEPEPKPVAMPRPDGVFVAERVNQSEDIAFVMQEAQRILGRAISPALSGILLASCDDYGLPADVVVMLLAYVKSIGKDNSSYIGSVVRNWSEEGIFTHEQAEEKLRCLAETAQAWRSVEQALGIQHRIPSAREEEFVTRWLCEWGFSTAMVREAYDRCVDSINRMDFKYIDKILTRWHQAGIKTTEQAFWDKQDKPDKPAPKTEPERTYDMAAYEQFDFLQAEQGKG